MAAVVYPPAGKVTEFDRALVTITLKIVHPDRPTATVVEAKRTTSSNSMVKPKHPGEQRQAAQIAQYHISCIIAKIGLF